MELGFVLEPGRRLDIGLAVPSDALLSPEGLLSLVAQVADCK